MGPNNNIHYIDPDIVPKSVQVLDISRNNLKCNCSTVDALRKLKKRIETFDFDTVKGCPENLNLSLTEAYEKLYHCSKYGNSGFQMPQIPQITIVIFVVVLICCIGIVTIYYKHQIRSKNKAMIHSDHFLLLPKNQNCIFDAFISYSDADWIIMENIYRHLAHTSENKTPIKLAFNHKDCIPGKPKEENMQDLIAESHRAIALVSQNYLQSKELIYELETVMKLQGGGRLVLIVLDIAALNNFIKSSPMLQNFVHAYSYLDFENGSPSFYKKLMKKLSIEPNKEPA